jgi:hypothetical protein
MSSIFRSSIVSHTAAAMLGAAAAAAFLTVHAANSQSLAGYISAICAKSFRSASAAEAPYLAENVSAMTKMMVDMGIKPSGDVDTDFVAMMAPHHQGAIEMAQAESLSRNCRRLPQCIWRLASRYRRPRHRPIRFRLRQRTIHNRAMRHANSGAAI